MATWNSRNLASPPWVTLPVHKSVAKKDSYKSTWGILQTSVNYSSEHIPYLRTEAQLLDRIIYKQSLRMRREKLLCHLKQVNKCLTRFMEVDIAKLIQGISDSWPSPDDIRIAASHVYMPSRQQINYTVVRIFGAAHLLHQAAEYALLAFDQALQQIQLGMIVHNMVVFCAIASRVWFLCHSFRKHLVELYDQLQIISPELEATQAELVSVDDLPKSLETIFGDDELFQLETEMKNKKSKLDNILDKFEFKNDMNKSNSELSVERETNKSSVSEDLGMPIARNIELTRAPVVEKKSKKRKTKKGHIKSLEEDTIETMDTTVEGIFEDDENYREPIATSTPAPNHPHFKAHKTALAVPSLEDLTEIDKDEKERTYNSTMDYNSKRLRIKIKKCKSMAKLLTVLTDNKSTIERRETGKFDHCFRKARKFRKKIREVEADEKNKLLKRAKTVLIKELDLGVNEESVAQKHREKVNVIQNNMIMVSSSKELRKVISDAAKKQLGTRKLQQQLQQNQGKFMVAGNVYKMKAKSVEILKGIVRKSSMKTSSSRTNLPVIVDKLITLFKQEMSVDNNHKRTKAKKVKEMSTSFKENKQKGEKSSERSRKKKTRKVKKKLNKSGTKV